VHFVEDDSIEEEVLNLEYTVTMADEDNNTNLDVEMASGGVADVSSGVEDDRIVVSSYDIAKEKKSNNKMKRSAESVPVAADSEVSNSVQGTVFDEDSKEELIGVNIYNQDKEIGAISSFDGTFEIQAEEGDLLEISYIGYANQKVEYSNEEKLQIAMEASVDLDSYVVMESTTKSSNRKAQPSIGFVEYEKYLVDNLIYPQEALDAEIKGKVTVEFYVNEHSELSDFKIQKSLGYGCDEEVIRLINEGPTWLPAIKKGEFIGEEVKVKMIFDH